MVDRRFGGFILSAIMANSVFMALEDDKDPGKLDGNPNVRNQIVSLSICGMLHFFNHARPQYGGQYGRLEFCGRGKSMTCFKYSSEHFRLVGTIAQNARIPQYRTRVG